MKTLLINYIHSSLGRFLLCVSLVIGCFAISQMARAVVPAPDGGYVGWNTAEGQDALFSLTTGSFNTAIGGHALYGNTFQSANTAVGAFALAANNPGDQNVAVGQGALRNNTGSSGNVAIGFQVLLQNTTGDGNTAVGYQALFSNTTGQFNTANGYQALFSNTTGFSNVATGISALSNNTTGFDNTATGQNALTLNTTGSNNTANGFDALQDNMTGNNNTACGVEALLFNVANNNTADGSGALAINTTGNNNTADGFQALAFNITGNNNTADGVGALSKNNGSSNIALGVNAGLNLTTGNNNIDIGNIGVTGESGKIRIGTVGTQNAIFVAGVHGVAVTGSAVLVSSTGQLGVAASSARFKEGIKPMDKASEAILALKPVTFRYKKEIDSERIPQFGLVAEEVEKVNPDLVVRDPDGKPYTVRYEAVNAMLLNEFLKAHRKMEQQEATIAQQQKQIEALTAGLQKVSAQVEMSRSAPQVVVNNQ